MYQQVQHQSKIPRDERDTSFRSLWASTIFFILFTTTLKVLVLHLFFSCDYILFCVVLLKGPSCPLRRGTPSTTLGTTEQWFTMFYLPRRAFTFTKRLASGGLFSTPGKVKSHHGLPFTWNFLCSHIQLRSILAVSFTLYYIISSGCKIPPSPKTLGIVPGFS